VYSRPVAHCDCLSKPDKYNAGQHRSVCGSAPTVELLGPVSALFFTAIRTASATAQSLPSTDSLLAHLDNLYRASSSHTVITGLGAHGRRVVARTLDRALVVIRGPARNGDDARVADKGWVLAISPMDTGYPVILWETRTLR
jgi:hypothetical protein